MGGLRQTTMPEIIIEAEGQIETSKGGADTTEPGGQEPSVLSRAGSAAQRYLFDGGRRGHARWAELLALAAVTGLAADP